MELYLIATTEADKVERDADVVLGTRMKQAYILLTTTSDCLRYDLYKKSKIHSFPSSFKLIVNFFTFILKRKHV